MQTLEQRFWKYVSPIMDDRGCWEWSGSRHVRGYGWIGDGKKRLKKAHRVAWEIHFGSIPAEAHVLHRCDNPSCVNPVHLFLGTHADNMRDMAEKGRHAKYSSEIVGRVRSLYSAGWRQADIVKETGVSTTHVYNLVNRKRRIVSP